MANTLLIAGIVCIVAAVVGGGIKMLGNELPVLGSTLRQGLLALVGVAFLIASYLVSHPSTSAPAAPPASAASEAAKPPPVTSPAANGPAPAERAPARPTAPPTTTGCGPANGLACLPPSSGPVNFRYPAAANEAAARNATDHLSTTEAQFEAQKEGATGKASRLCGIVASYDSSALGKHLAAVALKNGTAQGQATDACLRMAQNFL